MIRRIAIAIAAVLAVACAGVGIASAADDDEIFREAVVDGPADLVWRLMTTKQGMQSWLVPQAEVDWRVGGLIRTHHDPAGRLGDAQTTVSRVESLETGHRFTVKVMQTPEGYPLANFVEGTWYDVVLAALPGGKTRIRCVGHGLGEGWTRYATLPVFQQAADLAFGQLKIALASQVASKAAPKPSKKSPPKRTR